MAPFTTTVDRFCVREGDQRWVTDEGFLIDRWYGAEQLVEGLVPLTRALERSAVLLGPPGTGKTRGLKELLAAVVGASGGPSVTVDFGGVASDSAFERKTRPLAQDARDLASPTVVLLDGLDECPQGPKVMCEWLEGILMDRLRGDERVFIGCRSAAYTGLIRSTVRQLFHDPDHYTLAPLREADVLALAAERGVSPDAFLAEVRSVGAGPLAATPLTLDLLLTMYTASQQLPGRRADLYAAALPHLAVAQGHGRDETTRVGSRSQRVVTAGRVCAYLLLTGASGVAVDEAVMGLGEGAVLRIDELVGGPAELDFGEAIRVDDGLVRGTLDSALFTGRGPGVIAPAHNSYAAYLAASYLVARKCSAEQLRPLFVQRGELGTPGIHPALRETAAWLVGLAPEHGAWLATADPEALLPYTDLVDSPNLRGELTKSALSRAHDGLLQNWPSFGASWTVAHPGLAEVLRPYLTRLRDSEIDAGSPVGDFGAGRLALFLSEQVDSTGLVPDLLSVARAEHLPAATRAAAVRSAFRIAADAVSPDCREVLERVASGASSDPQDELRGCLLDLLWPQHLSVAELLRVLTPPRSELLGSYFQFRSGLSRRLREGDLDAVADWAASEAPADEGDMATLRTSRPAGRRDQAFFQKLVDRILAGPRARDRMAKAAECVLRLMRDDERELAVPAALCIPVEMPGGDTARELRREFVMSLVAACRDQTDASRIAFSWSHTRPRTPFGRDEALPQHFADRWGLVDEDDLAWLLEREAGCDDHSAVSLHPLIRAAWNPSDLGSWDIVWTTEGTRVWHAVFAGYFEPVPLVGEVADSLRRRHARGQKTVSPQRDELVASLNRFLVDGANGDTVNFWRLIHNLQFDLDDGSGLQRLDDDFRDWPGAQYLDDGWPELMDRACHTFLAHEHPHHNDWLGTDRYDLRAWAGYLAIAYLDRRPCGIQCLTAAVWRAWAPAIVWFPTDAQGAQADNKRRLIRAAAPYAQTELEDTFLVLLRAHVERAQPFLPLRAGDAVWSSRLESELLAYLPTLLGNSNTTSPADQTPDGWLFNATGVVELLIGNGADATRDYLLSQLHGSPPPITAASLRATVALKSLYADPAKVWPTIMRLMCDSEEDFDSITQAAAQRHWEQPLEAVLPETALIELISLLLKRYPPSSDPVWDSGARFLTGQDQVRSWRDRLLATLVDLGTPMALQAMRDLSASAPAEASLQRLTMAAEDTHRLRTWTSPTARELMQLLADQRNRIVRSVPDLAALVIEALNDIQKHLTSGIAQSFLLWNEIPAAPSSGSERGKPSRRPKHENDLSDYLAHELRMRLQTAGIVIDREVQVDRNATGSGNRTDLLVQATSRHNDPAVVSRVSLVVEVKGTWHKALDTAMEEQLVKDYLPQQGTRHGIYLVGNFPLAQWTDEADSRFAQAKRNRPDDIPSRLAEQADRLNGQYGVEVTPIVLSLALIDSAARNNR